MKNRKDKKIKTQYNENILLFGLYCFTNHLIDM